MSTVKPNGFILLQDPLFDGDLLEGTYGGTPALPSQAGPHAGPAVGEADNSGSLMPFCFGKWDESAGTPSPNPDGVQYKLTQAGGLFGAAEWVWKLENDAADQWRGMNDFRDFTHVHAPFGDAASPTAASCTHICAVYSRAYNKVLLFRYWSAGDDLELATRSVATTDPTSWATAYWPTPTGLDGYRNFSTAKRPSTGCNYSVGWENTDGSLRFSYPYSPTDADTTHDVTFDIWGSNDGGVTWEVLVEDVCTKYFGGYRDIKFLNADSSGDWIRLSMYVRDTTTNGLITAVSADGGSSWKIITEEPDGLDTISGDAYGQYEVSGICGLGTSDGMFLRVRASTASDLRYEVATRDSDWTLITSNALFYDTAVTPKAVYVGRGAAYAHVLVVNSENDSGGEEVCGYDGRLSYMIPLNAINDPRLSSDGGGAWLSRGHVTDGTPVSGIVRSGFMNQGYTAFRPKMGSNAYRWIGDRMMLSHTTYSHKSTATNYDSQNSFAGVVATYCMAYSRRPLRSRLWGTSDDTTNAYWIPYNTTSGSGFAAHESCNQWRTEWGGPTANAIGTTSATDYTPSQSFWTQQYYTTSLTATNTWQADQYEMTTGSNAFSFYYLDRSYLVTPSPPTGYGMGDRSVVTWTMKIDSSSNATLPLSNYDQPGIGLFIGDVNTLGTGGTFQISVALTTQEAAVYDVAAGTTLFHSTGQDFTKWHTFRLALGYSAYVGKTISGVYGNFGFGALGEATQWSSSGLMTLDNYSLSPVGYQWLQIGMGLGGANSVGTGSSSGNNNGIFLKDIIVSRGEDLSNLYFENPWSLRGVPTTTYQRHVVQGIYSSWGGGAGFKGDEFEMDVQYQYGVNQLNTPSPLSTWRSNNGSAQDLTFNAKSNDANAQFEHSGVALIGSNMRTARVEWDATTAFSSPSGITLDATIYSARVHNGAIAHDGVMVLSGQNVWKDHELAGKYFEWDNGTGATNQIFKIRDNKDQNIYMTGLTQYMSAFGISSGDTIHIYADQMMGIVPTEIESAMRVRIAAGKPAEDYWKIGRLVAGQTLPLTVPMIWQHSDTEVGNYDLTTNLSGTRQSRQLGVARRTIKGKVLGDAEGYRRSFRAAIREIAEYGNKPIILCQDDDSMAAQMLYCRFVDDTAFDNAGWRYDSSLGRWTRVGDMSVTFEEEV